MSSCNSIIELAAFRLIAHDPIRHESTHEWRQDNEEVAQMHVLGIPELGRKDVDEHLEVLGVLGEVLA